jgi:uncharacterized protein
VNGRPGAVYGNPYVAGVGVGLVMLAAFVLAGRGLGASGAFTSVVAAGVVEAAPERATASAYYAPYLPDQGSPLRDWLVFELAGVAIGGFLSALFAGRLRAEIARGPRSAAGRRLAYALGGGVLMGAGAKLARGCTSGLALNGGALLAVGAWIFIGCAFAAGYLFAPLVRRQWT